MLMPPGGAAATVYPTLEALLAAVRACRACEAHLPLGPRPVLRAGATARILVVGQAPGVRVHTTGIPWDDRGEEMAEICRRAVNVPRYGSINCWPGCPGLN